MWNVVAFVGIWTSILIRIVVMATHLRSAKVQSFCNIDAGSFGSVTAQVAMQFYLLHYVFGTSDCNSINSLSGQNRSY